MNLSDRSEHFVSVSTSNLLVGPVDQHNFIVYVGYKVVYFDFSNDFLEFLSPPP